MEKDLNIYLGLGEMKRVGKLGPFCNAQVLFLPELFLEIQQLLRGERRPGLPVGLVLAQVALEFGRFTVVGIWKQNKIK